LLNSVKYINLISQSQA